MSKIKVLRRIALLAVGATVAKRLMARRGSPIPCPASQSWVLDNPLAEANARSLLARMNLSPGMKVLDVGCGIGRLSIPIAERVGPDGEVVALDLQQKMLDKLEKRAADRGVTNIRAFVGGAGEGKLQETGFDLAILVSVLGEIPPGRREAALREIHTALKPGAILSVTEGLPDPDFQTRRTVRGLAEAAGFRMESEHRAWLGFTQNFLKTG